MTLAVVAMAACSGNPANNLTSPSVAANDANAGGPPPATVRYYAASISPSPVTASTSQVFTVVIKNCSSTSTAPCDGTHATTSTQKVQSATVVIPVGFGDPTSIGLSLPAGKTWNAPTWNAALHRIELVRAGAASNAVDPGEQMTLTFTSTAAASCAPYEFTTVAYQDTEFTTAYSRIGSQPTVTVTGCTTVQCTYGFGFWKTHGPDAPGDQSNLWPTTALPMMLGTTAYSASQLKSIMDAPVHGNGLISLAHHLITAKLNIANGVTNTIASTIAQADALIGSLVVPPVGGGSLTTTEVETLKNALAAFNTSNRCSDDDPDNDSGS
jgi:hypothetical protein